MSLNHTQLNHTNMSVVNLSSEENMSDNEVGFTLFGTFVVKSFNC